MARTQTLEQRDFVEAGTAYLIDHPLSALTMRVLGDLLGVDATACYRHFRSKDELLTAMVDAMLAPALDAVDDAIRDPRERVEGRSLEMRAAMQRNPQLASALAVGEGQMPNSLELSRRSIADLRAMGLDGDELVRAYQLVESYTMGATMFDLAAAPHNMDIRSDRYSMFGDEAFTKAGRSPATVETLTDDAFGRGLRALLDAVLAGTI